MVHGFVLMGRDVNTCIAAVDQLVTGQGVRAPGLAEMETPETSETPATTRMPEIVITMTEPPPPRLATPMVQVTNAEKAGRKPGVKIILFAVTGLCPSPFGRGWRVLTPGEGVELRRV